MHRFTQIAAATALTLVSSLAPAFAAGDLAIKATKLEELEIGGGEAGYDVSVKEYQLETGKSYTLEISSNGDHECEWEAEEFSRSIWLRSIEVGGVEINAPTFEGFAMDGEGEVEITFVPIRTGEFEWECEGLAERGVEGTFVVK